MAFKEVASLDAEVTYSLGKLNKKTGKTDPESQEGYYLGKRTVTTPLGDSPLFFLQTAKGNVGLWGNSDMNKKLSNVTPGTMVRVTANGTKPTKFGNMRVYRVEQDKTNTIEVEIAETAPAVTDTDEVEESTEDVEAAQAELAAAQAAAKERQARVQAMLNKGKSK